MINGGVQIAPAPAPVLDDGDPYLIAPSARAPSVRITAKYRPTPSEAIAMLGGATVEVEVSGSGVVFRVRR